MAPAYLCVTIAACAFKLRINGEQRGCILCINASMQTGVMPDSEQLVIRPSFPCQGFGIVLLLQYVPV
jgi:hypothetical protein